MLGKAIRSQALIGELDLKHWKELLVVPKRLLYRKAKKYNLDPKLVAAIIYQESRGCQWASRYEEGFYNRYIKHLTRRTLPGHVPPSSVATLRTEKHLRSISFGALQILGETAREMGFKEDELPQLFKNRNNLEYGCKYLRYVLDRTPTVGKALLKWNGGGDPSYDDRVLGHLQNGNWRKVFS